MAEHFKFVSKQAITKADIYTMRERESNTRPGETSPIVTPVYAEHPHAGFVLGQLFAGNAEGKVVLDELEGFNPDDRANSHYWREKILVVDAQGNDNEAWIYLADEQDTSKLIQEPEHVRFNVEKREYNWC